MTGGIYRERCKYITCIKLYLAVLKEKNNESDCVMNHTHLYYLRYYTLDDLCVWRKYLMTKSVELIPKKFKKKTVVHAHI